MAERGHFIVLEGLEGAGKSTAISTIEAFLKPRVSELIVTREPGGTQSGESIRQILKTHRPNEPLEPYAELLLFYAARVQLLEQVILPALTRGAWVLADRFELSTFAYQGGGRKIDPHFIEQLSTHCLRGLQPNLTLFLDLKPKIGLQRALLRSKMDRIESESVDFFERVYQSYHENLVRYQSVEVIDASKPLDEVQAMIQVALEQYMAIYD
jgi:dTMP kinase